MAPLFLLPPAPLPLPLPPGMAYSVQRFMVGSQDIIEALLQDFLSGWPTVSPVEQTELGHRLLL